MNSHTDTLANMPEQMKHGLLGERLSVIEVGDGITARHYWQAIGKFDAVMWQELHENGQVSGTFGPASLVMHRHIDIDALRGIPLSRLQPHRAGYPEFDQELPPTADQIRKAWNASAGIRARHEKADKQLGAFRGRKGSESVDEFYQRVADYYSRAMRATGRPVKALADAAGITNTTAARWVREARTRGFLEPTTRGKGKA
jgi:hypothetical protein